MTALYIDVAAFGFVFFSCVSSFLILIHVAWVRFKLWLMAHQSSSVFVTILPRYLNSVTHFNWVPFTVNIILSAVCFFVYGCDGFLCMLLFSCRPLTVCAVVQLLSGRCRLLTDYDCVLVVHVFEVYPHSLW
jgi:hypothetical protein